MKIEHHIVISALISGSLFAVFRSSGLAAASFLSGILIDTDHVIDYMIANRSSLKFREFLAYFYREKHQKITLLFHGWEWLCCLIAVSVITDFNSWITGFLAGYGQHIVLDFIYSKAGFLSYSLVWRWKKRFDSYVIFQRNRGYDP